jgi:hypothetical protein
MIRIRRLVIVIVVVIVVVSPPTIEERRRRRPAHLRRAITASSAKSARWISTSASRRRRARAHGCRVAADDDHRIRVSLGVARSFPPHLARITAIFHYHEILRVICDDCGARGGEGGARAALTSEVRRTYYRHWGRRWRDLDHVITVRHFLGMRNLHDINSSWSIQREKMGFRGRVHHHSENRRDAAFIVQNASKPPQTKKCPYHLASCSTTHPFPYQCLSRSACL